MIIQDPNLIDDLSQQFHVDVEQDIINRKNILEDQEEDPQPRQQSNKKKSESRLGLIQINISDKNLHSFYEGKGKEGEAHSEL